MGCARVLFTEKEEVGRFLENLQNGHSTNNTTAAKRKRRGRTNFLRVVPFGKWRRLVTFSSRSFARLSIGDRARTVVFVS